MMYVGADALTVEQSVATPIEQEMSGVDNMNYMYSLNANNGELKMYVNFDVNTDPNIDQVLTQHTRGDHVGAGADHGAVSAQAGPHSQRPPEHFAFGHGDSLVTLLRGILALFYSITPEPPPIYPFPFAEQLRHV
jgi:hypothetical protein